MAVETHLTLKRFQQPQAQPSIPKKKHKKQPRHLEGFHPTLRRWTRLCEGEPTLRRWTRLCEGMGFNLYPQISTGKNFEPQWRLAGVPFRKKFHNTKLSRAHYNSLEKGSNFTWRSWISHLSPLGPVFFLTKNGEMFKTSLLWNHKISSHVSTNLPPKLLTNKRYSFSDHSHLRDPQPRVTMVSTRKSCGKILEVCLNHFLMWKTHTPVSTCFMFFKLKSRLSFGAQYAP